MSTTTMTDVSRVPKGRIALWSLIGGELAIFGGAVACYLLYRLRFPAEYGEQGVKAIFAAGLINTLVLLTSSYTVVLAHVAATKKDTVKVGRYLGITLLLGFVFLGIKTFEYYSKISIGITMASPDLVSGGQEIGSVFWSFYYLMTGLHAMHVIVGMIAIFVVMQAAKKGKNLHRVELAGLYWHFVDIIWIFLFPLLYIAK